jgi:hypothetical protein
LFPVKSATKFKILEVSRTSQFSIAKFLAAVVIVPEATVCDLLTRYVPVLPVVPVICERITVSAVTRVLSSVNPGYSVPEPTAETVIVVPAIDAVTLAATEVKADVTAAKFATSRQFWILMFDPATVTFTVAAVSQVKVGRKLPPPSPTTATPEQRSAVEVASEILSLWPGSTKTISPRPGVQPRLTA